MGFEPLQVKSVYRLRQEMLPTDSWCILVKMRNIINIVRNRGYLSTLLGTFKRFHHPVRIAVLSILLALIACDASAAQVITPSRFNLKDYKGKVIYLDFWASWCGPCKFSFPYMKYLNRTFGGKDFVVIADNLDHSRTSAEAFLKKANVGFPVIFDQKGVLASRFHVSDMPTSVLIGRDGKVRYIHKGFYKEKEDEYTSHVLDLINQKN